MGPESSYDVNFIRPNSKTLGLACQTGAKHEDAHRCWPFSDGGQNLNFADELLDISFTSKNRKLEAVPVTRWHLTSPLNFSEGCHQAINS